MKKYLVIGNPIKHSLSPELHNHWIKQNNINAIYEKKKLNNDELENLILDIKKENIHGANITVPFKNTVITHLDELSDEAHKTQSVNTIYLKNKKVVGYNTDIEGFIIAIKKTNFDLNNKKIFILGAGGVVPSIIYASVKMGCSEIIISNRTKNKAEALAKEYNLVLSDWGKVIDFDIIINCTSIGLKKDDCLGLDFSNVKGKIFYDIIYKPKTKFLIDAEKSGNKIVDGKMMFLYQAQKSFEIWHGIKPEINKEVINLLND